MWDEGWGGRQNVAGYIGWDVRLGGMRWEMGSDRKWDLIKDGMGCSVGWGMMRVGVGVEWDWDWLAAMGWDGSRDEGSDKMGCGVGRQGMWLR